MIFLFGWRTYLLKSINPAELGLQTGQPDLQFEYRQRYFHLFFIPCFPIGRFWAVRQNGQLYHPSDQLKQLLAPVKSGRNGVWAWTAPILALVVYTFININQGIEERAYRSRTEQNKLMLAAFFGDKSKTAPLAQKVQNINAYTENVLSANDREKKAIDTSEVGLFKLYLEAKSTQDTISGYSSRNTFTVSQFSTTSNRDRVVPDDYKASLENGTWTGYQDTASVFGKLRELDRYEYLLILKEYNRVPPAVSDSGYAPGYSLVKGTIVSARTGEVKKTFKLIASNSSEVRHFNFGGGSSTSTGEWLGVLQNDLNNNVLSRAHQYVFGEASY